MATDFGEEKKSNEWGARLSILVAILTEALHPLNRQIPSSTRYDTRNRISVSIQSSDDEQFISNRERRGLTRAAAVAASLNNGNKPLTERRKKKMRGSDTSQCAQSTECCYYLTYRLCSGIEFEWQIPFGRFVHLFLVLGSMRLWRKRQNRWVMNSAPVTKNQGQTSKAKRISASQHTLW